MRKKVMAKMWEIIKKEKWEVTPESKSQALKEAWAFYKTTEVKKEGNEDKMKKVTNIQGSMIIDIAVGRRNSTVFGWCAQMEYTSPNGAVSTKSMTGYAQDHIDATVMAIHTSLESLKRKNIAITVRSSCGVVLKSIKNRSFYGTKEVFNSFPIEDYNIVFVELKNKSDKGAYFKALYNKNVLAVAPEIENDKTIEEKLASPTDRECAVTESNSAQKLQQDKNSLLSKAVKEIKAVRKDVVEETVTKIETKPAAGAVTNVKTETEETVTKTDAAEETDTKDEDITVHEYGTVSRKSNFSRSRSRRK